MFVTARIRLYLRGVIAATVIVVLLPACASTRDDTLQNASQSQLCDDGNTPSCIEKLGKPMRCFCADTEALRELLDPNHPGRR